MVHIKTFPDEAKEIAPTKIHYHKMAAPKGNDEDDERFDIESSVGSEIERLSQEWIPFFDAKGIQYFYNFSTGERMRRSPRASPASSASTTPRSKKGGGLNLDGSLGANDMERGLYSALEDDEGGAGVPQPKKNKLIKDPPPMLPRPIKPPYRTNALSNGAQAS